MPPAGLEQEETRSVAQHLTEEYVTFACSRNYELVSR